MSARMQFESLVFEETEQVLREQGDKNICEIQIERLLRDVDRRNLVAPLRNAQEALTNTEDKRQAALALQEEWNSWLERRDVLRNEIKRGHECLEQTRKDLTALRAQLDDWPAFERHCGINPLVEYAHSISAKESVAAFLPDWLRRREDQLQVLTRKLEDCARQNGLEHLL